MAVSDDKMLKSAGTPRKCVSTSIVAAIDLTAAIVRIMQIPFGFVVDSVQLYCSAVTGAVTILAGIVRPGRAIQAVTLVIGTTTTKFKLSVAITAVMPARAANALPIVVNKAIADNIAFSSAFTINVAAALGQWWGAVRVQMDAAGVVSTKVVSADQAYADEAGALYACPAPDPGYFDLGTITIECATGAAFTAQTTALNAAGTTVNYNGVDAGFVNVATADLSFVAAEFQSAVMEPFNTRAVAQIGGLLVLEETTDGSGAVTDGVVDIFFRPFPLNGEVAAEGT